MTNPDAVDFFRRLAVLSELYHGAGAVFSDAKAELYFEALRDLSLDAVVLGLNRAVQRCKFMPLPAEIRTLAIGDSEDHAEAAWMLLRGAFNSVGSYTSLVVSDPALGEAIVACFGSWPQACASELTPEMWASKRKEFGRIYRVLLDRQLVGARYLPGICEAQNSGKREWAKYTPVVRLEAAGVERLTLEQAEQARMQIAASSHGFRRLGEGFDPPMQEGQSA